MQNEWLQILSKYYAPNNFEYELTYVNTQVYKLGFSKHRAKYVQLNNFSCQNVHQLSCIKQIVVELSLTCIITNSVNLNLIVNLNSVNTEPSEN